MRPSFFGFETGEPRKFRNLPDEKIGMGRTKRQNIGYFCPAEKVCAGCTVRIGRFLNLLCGGRIGFCPNRVAQFCSGAIRYAFVLQQPDTPVHGGHEQIGGTAGLKNSRLTGHLRQGNQLAAGVEKGGLGQAGEHFVQTGHRQVRPLGHGAGGKGRVEPQVGPVGLVHQNRNPLGMGRRADPRRVADHPVIGGAGIDHQLHPRVVLQRLGHLLRGEGAGQAEGLLHRGQQEHRVQAAKLNGVVDSLVAVAGHQNLVPPAGGRPDGRQQPACAAVDLEIALPAPPELGRPVHPLGQHAGGVVEVVKLRQFRDVQLGPQPGQVGGQRGVLLVPRHVEGEVPRLMMGLQALPQSASCFFCHKKASFAKEWIKII